MTILRTVRGLKVLMTIESAHSQGLIGCWHYQWLRFLKGLKHVRSLLLARPPDGPARD